MRNGNEQKKNGSRKYITYIGLNFDRTSVYAGKLSQYVSRYFDVDLICSSQVN